MYCMYITYEEQSLRSDIRKTQYSLPANVASFVADRIVRRGVERASLAPPIHGTQHRFGTIDLATVIVM